MKYGLVATALVIIAILIAKFRGFLYKTKDAALVKEDQALKTEQTKVETQITELKKPTLVPDLLTPEEVEDFWNKGKK